MKKRPGPSLLATLLLIVFSSGRAQTPTPSAVSDLGGTSWQLVKFQGSDDKTLTPADERKYTLAFTGDGVVSLRVDCNRGHGTWKSPGANQLQFGSLAVTLAMCPPAPFNDRIPKDWEYVRSYVLKDGHLFLSLMADRGTYEFEPLRPEQQKAGQIRGTATYSERMALPPKAVFEATLEDVSKADSRGQVLLQVRIENPGNPPIPFQIPYDPSHIRRKPPICGASPDPGGREGVFHDRPTLSGSYCRARQSGQLVVKACCPLRCSRGKSGGNVESVGWLRCECQRIAGKYSL